MPRSTRSHLQVHALISKIITILRSNHGATNLEISQYLPQAQKNQTATGEFAEYLADRLELKFEIGS